MAKKKVAVIVTAMLVFSMLPGLALGAEFSLDLNRSFAAVGDSIIVSGTAGPNEWVCIKVMDSSRNIVVFDTIKSTSSGDYSYSFKVPRVSPGTLTVVAGCGNNVKNEPITLSTFTLPIIIPELIIDEFVLVDEIIRSQTISSRGGIIKIAEAMFTFPANAVSEDVEVTIKKLSKDNIPSVSSKFKLLGTVYEITTDKNIEFKKPVTITLYFDQDEVDNDKYNAGIYCWSNREWVLLDQVQANLDTGKVSGTVNHFSIFAVLLSEKSEIPIKEENHPVQEVLKPVKSELKDIANHWAEKFITELVAIGAVSGYLDGTFKPDNSITRAEFATMLIKAFQLEPKNGKVFSDITGHWAQDNIRIAAAHGIVSGYNETSFGPDDLITREQMAVMINKAANLTGGEGKTFTDNNLIADWAIAAVAATSAKNIFSGYPNNTFGPRTYANRAEAVTVIVKALNYR